MFTGSECIDSFYLEGLLCIRLLSSVSSGTESCSHECGRPHGGGGPCGRVARLRPQRAAWLMTVVVVVGRVVGSLIIVFRLGRADSTSEDQPIRNVGMD